MSKPTGVFEPEFSLEEIGRQSYQHLASTLGALDRQFERYSKGLIDRAKWTDCERANAYRAPISMELRQRELSGMRP